MSAIRKILNPNNIFVRSGKSVFVRTFCILLALLSGIMLLFIGLLNREYQRHHRERLLQSNGSLLVQTGNLMEGSISILQDQLNQVLWSSHFIEYLMNPSRTNQQSVYDIQAVLGELADSNPLFQEIWLYSVVDDQVIDSSGEYSKTQEFSGSHLIQKHSWAESMSEPNSKEGMTEILIDEGQIFLVQDIVLSKPLGSIYARLDMQSLAEALNLAHMEQTLWIMESDAQIIHLNPGREMNKNNLPSADQLQAHAYADASEVEDYSGEKWLGSYKETLDMYFLLIVSQADMITGVSEVLPELLPQLVIFLILGIAGCFFITDSIYRPINHLVEMVLNVTGEENKGNISEGRHSNEMDYLKLSFFRTLDEKKKLEYSMRRFYDDIVEQGIRKLLQGESREASGLNELDPEWCLDWSESDRYQVILCRKSTELNSLSSIADGQLFYRIIEGLVHKNDMQLHARVIPMELNLTAILLCSFKGQTPEHFREESFRLEENLSQSLRNTAYKVHISHGKQYTELEDIYYSMQEARQMMEYEDYVKRSEKIGKEQTGISAVEEEALEPVLLNEVYYRERSRHVLDHILKNQKKEALELAHRVLDKMSMDTESEADEQRLFEIFMTGITEKYRNMCGKDCSTQSCDKSQRLLFVDRVLEEIWSVSTKNTYRYVEMAKQYMEEHYSDVNLSIQEVADYVNIHSTYLSKIFSEFTGESYSNYINLIRVRHAKELLAQTDETVREIGFRCGFNTVQSFNRVFKKHAGTTPTEFRRNIG